MEKQAYQTTYENEKSYWWYRARAEIMEYVFAREVNYKNMKILNIGCGTGYISQRFSRFGSLINLDLSSAALAFCSQNQLDLLVQADSVHLPFRDKSFDACLAFDVLEHIEDDDKAVAEINRVLRHDGFLIITVPAFQCLWSKMDDLGHLRRYSRKRIELLLGQVDLELLSLSYYNFFLLPFAFVQRFFERFSHKEITSENFLPPLPGIINELFYSIFKWERIWIGRLPFPFGLSLLAVSRRR